MSAPSDPFSTEMNPGSNTQNEQSLLTSRNDDNNNISSAGMAGQDLAGNPITSSSVPVYPSFNRGTSSTLVRPPPGRLSPLQNNGAHGEEQQQQPGFDRCSPPPRLPPKGMAAAPAGPHVSGRNENIGDVVGANDLHILPHAMGIQTPPHSQHSRHLQSSKMMNYTGVSPTHSRNVTSSRADHPTGGSQSMHSVSESVEQLYPLKTEAYPVERFFVEYHGAGAAQNANDAVRPEEDEVLFDCLGEYTDDDSFFSSGISVIEEDPRRLQKDAMRGRALHSVYDTLNLRALTGGRMPQELDDGERSNAGWMYQVHKRAIALHHSSFFVFPPGMTARIVVYNVMHHWLTELLLIFIIIGYSIFTASWGRYSWPYLYKPAFMVFADVFYTVVYGVEILARLFASGCILHPRAFFRSPWHCLDAVIFVLMILNCTSWDNWWNFTAFRLIRVIKSCTYVPLPLQMKLLAKSFLRSTNKLLHVSIILLYALFFFALLGLQLFRGRLHYRCVSMLTGISTAQLCNPDASPNAAIHQGYTCPDTYKCSTGPFPNPHYGFRSFDDVGHALLSTFQIMTFQGWTNLLQETNDTLAKLAILYYAFTILFCAWFIPSLYVGVFIEKIEKTSRLFMQKQLKLFDSMLLEQQQRLNEAVKLRDFIERDHNGNVQHHPFNAFRGANYDNQNQQQERDDHFHSRGDASEHAISMHSKRSEDMNLLVPKKRTKWTDEQRVQLHLSLTRQRDIAEQADRKRSVTLKMGEKGETLSEKRESRPPLASTGLTGGDFALGGRVGMVQHHPLSHTIGAAHGTDLPLAVRLENEGERLKFFKDYQTPVEEVAMNGSNGASNSRKMRVNEGIGVSGSASRPPLSPSMHQVGNSLADETIGGIIATRESAGVIPSRRTGQNPFISSKSISPLMMRSSNTPLRHEQQQQQEEEEEEEDVAAAAAAAAVLQQRAEEDPELLINDPEGGDFRFAQTLAQRWAIVRNILHMFTEGYPRILTQYLWEHKHMQRRFGLMPLNYVNKYEEAALRKLRQRIARRGRRFQENNQVEGDDDDDFSGEMGDVFENSKWCCGGGHTGKLSPIRMAKNIVENVPVTIFGGIMLFFVFANVLLNALRHYGQPSSLDDSLFIIGVCFTSLFMLEILIRVLAMGPGPFMMDFFNALSFVVTVIGFFELGFARSNVITVLNSVRVLRLLRIAPCTPMRRVSRVLLLGIEDIVYALFFFSIYMFMWILIGMSFFGSRTDRLDRVNDDYRTRGHFDTFSHAAFAVSQAVSYNRDEWVYLSWDGMRARGGYTVMYFLAVVGVAFVFRYLFISIFTWAWQREEECEDYALHVGGNDGTGLRNRGGPRLRWFDFTVWRSFKHIHGGFQRRDVAPDEVFHLNEDMRRQLRIAEAKERFHRETFLQYNYPADHRQPSCSTSASGGGLLCGPSTSPPPPLPPPAAPSSVLVPRFVSVGGKLQRQMSNQGEFSEMRQPPINAPISQFQAENAQLRFARRYTTVPATAYSEEVEQDVHTGRLAMPYCSPSDGAMLHVSVDSSNALLNTPEESYNQLKAQLIGADGGMHTKNFLEPIRRSSVTSRFPKLDYERPSSIEKGAPVKESGGNFLRKAIEIVGEEHDMNEKAGGGVVYEHVLLPGPRLRYKHVTAGPRRRIFERCLDCNTHKQMPLRAPPNVQQRTADELHAEHCHMAAARSSRQFVMNAITGYVRLQSDLDVPPTREAVETVLGQAWSCGMLLFETIEYLSCADVEFPEHRTWDRTLEALQLQQWLIGLHVGEEQVGRATLAYILAQRESHDRLATVKSFKDSWRDRSLFLFPHNHPLRSAATSIVGSMWFEIFILAVIFVASVCLCFYSPGAESYSTAKYITLNVLDDIFAVVFLLEMLLKWISMGVVLDLHVAYLWHRWNVFDCFITFFSLVGMFPAYQQYRCLKALRCFRIFGLLRYCTFNDSIAKLAMVMWNCVPTVANVLLLCLLNYIVWAILAVRLFMGLTHSCSISAILSEKECLEQSGRWLVSQRNFDNFYESLLTMFEVSTGSKWFDVIYLAVDGLSMGSAPTPNFYPSKGFFFIAYYYVSHLVLFSLFVASMIYGYLLVKNASEGVMGITFEHQLWIRMQHMISRLTPRVQLIPLGNPVSRFLHRVVTHRIFEVVMTCLLLLNILTMSLHWYGNSTSQETAMDALQYVWVAAFTAEVLMGLTAHGFRAFSRWTFCFDTFVVLLSLMQIIVEAATNHTIPFNVNVLRVLRLGRILKLLDFLPVRDHLRLLHEVLLLSAPSFVNVTLILLLALFVFAVLGMHLIGPVIPLLDGYIDDKYNNFLTFPNALMMIFRLSTMEDWVSMLRGSLPNAQGLPTNENGAGAWAPVFYVPIVVCFSLMIVSLYTAVVVDHYVTVIRMNANVTRIHDLRRFRELWSALDPNATLVLQTRQLPAILEGLRPPLGISSRHNRVELLSLLREYDIPDHDGKVHYHEVLLPLARRVLAMAFSADEIDDGATFDSMWRFSEKSLRALPTVLVNQSHATTAQYFAASYLQAAFRRERAYLQVYQARVDLWHEGRGVCDELGLPYTDYGFGSQALSGEDPRMEAMRRGLSVESARERRRQKRGTAATEEGEHSISPVTRSEDDGGGSSSANAFPAAHLPGVYLPATDEKEKRFGPDVPNALRRRETRSEKLRRREGSQLKQQQQQQHLGGDSPSWSSQGLLAPSQRQPGSDQQPPLGTDPKSWLDDGSHAHTNLDETP